MRRFSMERRSIWGSIALRDACLDLAMALTEARIRQCAGHDELLELLFSDLRTRLPPEEPFHMGRFLQQIRTVPVGLRAMAVTFELDVSMALDDLGWHFGNWGHRPYCDQTLWVCANWRRSNMPTCLRRPTSWRS
jgi:hypothetical protein